MHGRFLSLREAVPYVQGNRHACMGVSCHIGMHVEHAMHAMHACCACMLSAHGGDGIRTSAAHHDEQLTGAAGATPAVSCSARRADAPGTSATRRRFRHFGRDDFYTDVVEHMSHFYTRQGKLRKGTSTTTYCTDGVHTNSLLRSAADAQSLTWWEGAHRHSYVVRVAHVVLGPYGPYGTHLLFMPADVVPTASRTPSASTPRNTNPAGRPADVVVVHVTCATPRNTHPAGQRVDVVAATPPAQLTWSVHDVTGRNKHRRRGAHTVSIP